MDRGNGKAQVVLLVPQSLIDRVDALRIVMNPGKEAGGINRARVIETALTPAVEELEAEYAARLNRLGRLAEQRGITLEQAVRQYAHVHQRKTYAPTLEELENSTA
jgi:hypothetical protein